MSETFPRAGNCRLIFFSSEKSTECLGDLFFCLPVFQFEIDTHAPSFYCDKKISSTSFKYSGERKKCRFYRKGYCESLNRRMFLIFTQYIDMGHGTSLSKHVTFILSCLAAEKQNT